MKVVILLFACTVCLNFTSSTETAMRRNPLTFEEVNRNIEKDKLKRLAKKLGPSPGNRVYLQLVGGRILSGILLLHAVPRGVPQETFFTALVDGSRILYADLRTIKNETVPEVIENRCFIPIRRDFALTSILVESPAGPRVDLSADSNAVAILQEPNQITVSGSLHPTNGQIPTWLHGLVCSSHRQRVINQAACVQPPV